MRSTLIAIILCLPFIAAAQESRLSLATCFSGICEPGPVSLQQINDLREITVKSSEPMEVISFEVSVNDQNPCTSEGSMISEPCLSELLAAKVNDHIMVRNVLVVLNVESGETTTSSDLILGVIDNP